MPDIGSADDLYLLTGGRLVGPGRINYIGANKPSLYPSTKLPFTTVRHTRNARFAFAIAPSH